MKISGIDPFQKKGEGQVSYELIILRQGSASRGKKGKKGKKKLLPLLMKLILKQVGGSGLDAKRS